MATLTYDFEGDAGWTQPAGWDPIFNGGGTWYSRIEPTTSYKYHIGGSATWVRANCTDITADMDDVLITGERCSQPFGGYFLVLARSDLAAFGAGGLNAYRMDIASDGTANRWLYIDKYVNGTQTLLAQVKVVGLSYAAWIDFKFEVSGTTIRAKIWEYGEPEPAAWVASVTDTSHSTGRVELMGQGGNAYFDNIGISSADITSDVLVTQGNTGELTITGYDAVISSFGFATQGNTGELSTTGYDFSIVISGDVTQSAAGSLLTTGYDTTITGELAKDKLFIKYKDEFENVREHEISQLPIITEVSTDFISAEQAQCVFVDATSDNLTGYMVTAAGRDGVEYNITKVDTTTNTVTVTPLTGEYINGETEFVLYFQDENLTIIGNNGDWRVL